MHVNHSGFAVGKVGIALAGNGFFPAIAIAEPVQAVVEILEHAVGEYTDSRQCLRRQAEGRQTQHQQQHQPLHQRVCAGPGAVFFAGFNRIHNKITAFLYCCIQHSVTPWFYDWQSPALTETAGVLLPAHPDQSLSGRHPSSGWATGRSGVKSSHTDALHCMA